MKMIIPTGFIIYLYVNRQAIKRKRMFTFLFLKMAGVTERIDFFVVD